MSEPTTHTGHRPSIHGWWRYRERQLVVGQPTLDQSNPRVQIGDCAQYGLHVARDVDDLRRELSTNKGTLTLSRDHQTCALELAEGPLHRANRHAVSIGERL